MLASDLGLSQAIVADALHFDYRFAEDADGRFRLLLHDRLSRETRAPLLRILHDLLYWRGIPTTSLTLQVEAGHWMESAPAPEIITRVMCARPQQFALCGNRWLLQEWLGDECQFEPGFALVEATVGDSASALLPADVVRAAVHLLRHVPAPVPFSRLYWAMGRLSAPARAVSRPHQAAAVLLDCQHVVFLRNGQVALKKRLEESLRRMRALRPARLRRLRDELFRRILDHQSDGDSVAVVLSSLKREAAKAALHHLQVHATGAVSLQELLRHTAAEEQIIERIRVVGAPELSSDEVSALAARMQSEVAAEVRASLRRGGVIFLPGDRVALVDPERAEALASALCSEVSGLERDGVLRYLWPDGAPAGMDGRALVNHMAEFDLECSEGYWHAGRARLSEIARSSAASVLDWLQERRAPADLSELAARTLPLDSNCPAPVLRIVLEIVAAVLGRRAGFWRLECGAWWATPDRLVTDERLRELLAAGVSDEDIERAIEDVLGLQLDGLTSGERADVFDAFRSRMPMRPGGEAQEAPPPEPEDMRAIVALAPPEPASEIPRSSYVTLTADMIEAGCLRLSPGAKKILAAQCSEGISFSHPIAVTVEGRFRVQGQLVDHGTCLVSDGLFTWLSEHRARPGDRVVFYAPTPPGVFAHVALEQERQPLAEAEHGKRLAHHLRECIFGVLHEHGSARHIDAIVAEVSAAAPGQVRRSSIEATLSTNTHLFAAWGRAIWGLREWADDWSDYVDLQLLLWRIEEEDLVVLILTEAGRPLSEAALAREISRRFRIRVESVWQVSFLRRDDPRLVWDPISGLVRLASGVHPGAVCAPYLHRHVVFMNRHPASRRRIRDWFRTRWERSLDDALSEYGLTLQP